MHSLVEKVFADGKSRVGEALLEINQNRVRARLSFKLAKIGTRRLVLVFIDFTPDTKRRSQMEQLLRKNEQLYRQLVEEANDIVFQCNAHGYFTFVNPIAVKMTGYSEKELMGKHYLDLVHPEYRDDAARFYGAQLVEGLASTYYEFPFLTKKGEMIWVGQNVRLLVESGKVTGVQAICRDITERKRMEDALRESEKRFRAIFEGAEDYIFLKDKSFRYIDVNPAGQRLVGLSASEIIGRCYEDLFGPEDAAYLRDLDTRVLQGQSIEEEHTVKINGIPRVLFETRAPLRDDLGEIIGVLVIARDITDRTRVDVSADPEEQYPSEAMQKTLKSARLAAEGNITLLLLGESGSGKDHLARYIHKNSDRANGPYFSINCAAIAPELAESELFGHEKGAFTGAYGRKRGLLELAEGGTLLLNEIGELSLPLQAKLLTFLDTRKFTRVGGEKVISVNARLIAATNRDLEQEVRKGRFREDLFYRINVMSIEIPPLRERREDIPLLVEQVLSKLLNELQIQTFPAIDPAAANALKRYDWPGNVRELRNVLERALILSHGKKIDLFALGLSDAESLPSREEKACFSISFPTDRSLNEMTQELKRFMVNEALRRSGGSRQGAATLLGISRHSLKHYMKTLGYDDE
ncbi:sigma 54-interacting transcriptional regulator [Desulfomonile tiedjei]|uniref:sigma 54-interacting transcriptional regulator n=1 Tax=Desulfomonile tiedjei TaxID=2358 RepID=UPI0012F73730|nr:sigma 54-interacting transcriptional regulator [Desulfomonile tiedjei]